LLVKTGVVIFATGNEFNRFIALLIATMSAGFTGRFIDSSFSTK
jgi:hypothetical protein